MFLPGRDVRVCPLEERSFPREIRRSALEFRRGLASDAGPIRLAMAKALMNPLDIDVSRFVVAAEGSERVGFAQLKPLGENSFELASVYVQPRFRDRGIGAELVRRALERRKLSSDVFLLTLDRTAHFYGHLGFHILQDLPSALYFEFAAGNIITGIIGERLVCMRYDTSDDDKE